MKKLLSVFVLSCLLFIGCGSGKEKPSLQMDLSKQESFMHVSIDDVKISIMNLADNDYKSIWDEPLFNELYSLHNDYGAQFSLYVYLNDPFQKIGDTYQTELYDASEWLKFGLHSADEESKYDNTSTYQDGNDDWSTFADMIISFTGTDDSIDRIPRLHYFSGSKDCLIGMKDAEYGALGFLSADDSRISYYLTDKETEYLWNHDFVFHPEENLVFISTDMRGDWFNDNFSTENQYDKPDKKSVYKELEDRFSDGDYKERTGTYIWFCHEWQFHNGSELNKNKKWIEDACQFANDYGLRFDYPQNNIQLYAN